MSVPAKPAAGCHGRLGKGLKAADSLGFCACWCGVAKLAKQKSRGNLQKTPEIRACQGCQALYTPGKRGKSPRALPVRVFVGPRCWQAETRSKRTEITLNLARIEHRFHVAADSPVMEDSPIAAPQRKSGLRGVPSEQGFRLHQPHLRWPRKFMGASGDCPKPC